MSHYEADKSPICIEISLEKNKDKGLRSRASDLERRILRSKLTLYQSPKNPRLRLGTDNEEEANRSIWEEEDEEDISAIEFVKTARLREIENLEAELKQKKIR